MNGIPVARILGFEIRLHLSWVFIVAIITVTVAGRLTDVQPGIDQATAWIAKGSVFWPTLQLCGIEALIAIFSGCAPMSGYVH